MNYIINILAIIAVTIISVILSFINFLIYTDNNIHIMGFLFSILLSISIFIIWIALYKFINSTSIIEKSDKAMFHLCFGFYLIIELFYAYSILSSFLMLIEKANPYRIFNEYFYLVFINRLLFFLMIIIFYIYLKNTKAIRTINKLF